MAWFFVRRFGVDRAIKWFMDDWQALELSLGWSTRSHIAPVILRVYEEVRQQASSVT